MGGLGSPSVHRTNTGAIEIFNNVEGEHFLGRLIKKVIQRGRGKTGD